MRSSFQQPYTNTKQFYVKLIMYNQGESQLFRSFWFFSSLPFLVTPAIQIFNAPADPN